MEPLPAYAFRKHDPAAVAHFLLLWAFVQLLIRLVGRDSLDNEGWRSAVLALLATSVPSIVYAMASTDPVKGLVAAAILLTLTVWLVAGFLYEPEFRQRIILATAIPGGALLLAPQAWWLRSRLIDTMAP